MDFSIIIVSWNVKEKLKENLEQVFASEGVSFEVIVVDNASIDGTAEMVRASFPEALLIENKDNRGFAKASNQGLYNAQGRYVLLLNPDMRLENRTLAEALAWLEKNPQAAISGIRLVDSNGKIVPQVRRFPGLFDQLMITLKLVHVFPAALRSYLRQDFDYTKASRVDSIRGAFFVIRRAAFERLGPLDERYFLWFEEVDYCRQARAAGLEVWYTPAATAVDYIGQSFNQLKRSTKQRYFKESMIAYFKKWHPGLPALFIRLAWLGGDCITFVGDAIKLKSRTRT